MRIAKIMSYKRKAISEAQKEVDKIFEKYSVLINKEISNQIPIGLRLISGNGMCMVLNENNEEVNYGNAWSFTADTCPKMDKIAGLQYGTDNDDIQGNFSINSEIKGTLS